MTYKNNRRNLSVVLRAEILNAERLLPDYGPSEVTLRPGTCIL
jgi:hypothetical protein